MAVKSGTLGSLLQGVSQQPARIRLAGQVSRQVNMDSDITAGLTTRAGTVEVFDVGDITDMEFETVTLADGEFLLGYKEGTMRMWDLDGVEQTITESTSNALDYIGSSIRMQAVTNDDGTPVLVVCNPETTVAKLTTVDFDTEEYYRGYVWLVGNRSRTRYNILITSGGVEYSVFKTTDYIEDSASARAVQPDEILTEMEADFNDTTFPGTGSGDAWSDADISITLKGNSMMFTSATTPFTLETYDGQGDLDMQSTYGTVSKAENLPPIAVNGQVLRINNTDGGSDDMWVRFQVKDFEDVSLDGHFGKEGQWEESFNNAEERYWDVSTLPHGLVNAGGTDWEFGELDWIPRPVGDSDSAPFASILGRQIKDIAGFEGRLCLLASPYVVMSRSNKPFDLWRQTVSTVSASDPIDFTSTKKNAVALTWFVPFERDMYIVSDPGDSQFLIRGGGLTPNNQGMVLANEYICDSQDARPAITGRSMFFPFSTGEYSGIKEYYTAGSNGDKSLATTLTESQDKYLAGSVRHIITSPDFNRAMVLVDSDETVMYQYQYLWDRDELMQSAWSAHQFTDKIKHAWFSGSRLYIVGYTDLRVFLHYMDLNRPDDAGYFHVTLDRKVFANTDARNEVTVPYSNARFVQGEGTELPGREVYPIAITPQSGDDVLYEFDKDEVAVGAELASGQQIDWYLSPTRAFAKDYQGRVDTSKQVTIQEYVVHLYNSGEFTSEFTGPYGDFNFDWQVFPMDDDPNDPNLLGITTGEYFVPCGERAEWHTFTMHGYDIKPVTIHEVEWVGQVLNTRGVRS